MQLDMKTPPAKSQIEAALEQVEAQSFSSVILTETNKKPTSGSARV